MPCPRLAAGPARFLPNSGSTNLTKIRPEAFTPQAPVAGTGRRDASKRASPHEGPGEAVITGWIEQAKSLPKIVEN